MLARIGVGRSMHRQPTRRKPRRPFQAVQSWRNDGTDQKNNQASSEARLADESN
jgi:hypothetical protein